MVHRLQTITLSLFALFALGPTVTLLAFGPADPYVHGREATPWPSLADVLEPAPEGRERLVDALLDRSALRREAIRLRNRLTFRGLGYADDERVVSGAPGWLFYKPAFAAWTCDEHARLDQGLRRLMLLVELAEVNDLPLVVASAPNKASIHPEYATGRAALYADCYARYARRFRAATDRIDSRHWVDHARTLAPTARDGDAYHRTDTHWTLFEAYRALEDLAATTGWYSIPDERPTRAHEAKSTDLGDQILLLAERADTPIARPPDAEPRALDAKRRVLLVHDSFYEEASRYLPYFLPGAERVNLNRAAFRQVDFAAFDALVIESVERELLRRFRSHAHFSWFSPAGQWLQARMEKAAAEQCDWNAGRDLLAGPTAAPVYEDLERQADGTLVARGPAPKLWVDLPAPPTGGAVCLSLEIALDADPQPRRAARLFLDGRATPISTEDAVAEFSYGRTVEIRYGRERERLAFVVPPSALGRRVRLDLPELAEGTRLVSLVRAEAPARGVLGSARPVTHFTSSVSAQSATTPTSSVPEVRARTTRPGSAAAEDASAASSSEGPPTSTPA